MNPGLIKSYVASAATSGYLFAKLGAADNTALAAAGSSDLIIGVTEKLDTLAGEDLDVIHTGLAEIRLGGAVTRGQELTSDANGAAIFANPAAGANVRIGAIAMASGVAGDIIPALVTLGLKQG